MLYFAAEAKISNRPVTGTEHKASMSIDFQTDVKDDHVLLVCRGTFNSEALLGIFEKALVIANREQRKAALIDVRDLKAGVVDTMVRYEFGVNVAKLLLGSGIRIAFVGDGPFIDPGRFGETVAANRGVNGRVFTDIKEADTWIRRNVAE